MAKTINAVSIAVTADTKLVRNEIRSLQQILRQTEDPVVKLNRQVELLDKALHMGKITTKQHADAIEALSKKTETAINPVDMLTSKLGSMATIAGAIALATTAVNELSESIERVDTLSDAAAGMGAEYNSLQVFAGALREVGGVSFEGAIAGMKHLNTQVGLASMGLGKNVKIFEALGLDPKSLADLNAEEKFIAVGEAIAKLKNPSEQAAIAMKLLGDSQLAGLIPNMERLKQVTGEIKGTTFALTPEELERMSQTNDRLDRLSLTLSSAKDKITAFAVSNEGIGEVVSKFLGSSAGSITSMLLNYTGALDSAPVDKMAASSAALTEELAKQAEAVDQVDASATKYFDTQSQSLAKQIELLKFGEEYVKVTEKLDAGLSEPQMTALINMEKERDILLEQKKIKEENIAIEKQNAEIISQRNQIELEGLVAIQKIEKDAADKAASTLAGPKFATFVQADTKQAFDYERKRQQDNSKILAEQVELQKKIADATQKTADKIDRIKQIQAAR